MAPLAMTKMRVFIGLSEVAGYFSGLEQGMRSIGADARFFNLSANPLAYGAAGSARSTGLLRLRYATRTSLRYRVWVFLLRINRLLRRVRAAALFPWAVIRYDVFILGGHELFLGGLDLWLMTRLGKRVIIVFTGSDHRPPYLSAFGLREHPETKSLGAVTRRTRARVRRVERWATAIVALPESAQLHRRPFIDFLAIGIPFAPADSMMASEPPSPSRSSGPVRILHCPTDPEAKGSPGIRAAVERCRQRGLEIEYRELTGRPNAEVLTALASSDLVVDELYSDTPMARFATEAAFFGKPTIVGGYAARSYGSRPGDGPVPATLFCPPEALDDALAYLVSDRDARLQLGRQAQDFVLRRWTSDKVARRLMRVIEGEAPTGWMVRPQDLTYVHGWGIAENTLRQRVRQLVNEQGVEALALAPESHVQTALLALARTSSSDSDAHANA